MHEHLETWAGAAKPSSTVVTMSWERVPRLAEEFDQAAASLARAALTFYPALYTSAANRERQPDGAPKTNSEADAQLTAAASRMRGTSSLAVERILESCRHGRLPLLTELTSAERVCQLSLALDPEQLVIELLVRSVEPPQPGWLFAFGKGAEWVARNSGARVVMVIPDVFANSTELDGVTYGALAAKRDRTKQGAQVAPTKRSRGQAANDNDVDRRDQPSKRKTTAQTQELGTDPNGSFTQPAQSIRENEAAARADADGSSPAVSVAAVIGRPHPGSDAEQRLHAKLIGDAELGPLFRFNQLIKTRHGTTPRVDLVWPDGKLVIEIDGHADHSRAGKFCHDRERDYQLLITGYRVLRVPEMFVLMDLQLTLERIRTAVRFLKEDHGL
jgi:very-short-patch-repair endonuclease